MNYLFIRAIRSRCSFGKETMNFHRLPQILFSDNFPVSFAAEDMAVMGDVIIGFFEGFSEGCERAVKIIVEQILHES